MNPKLDKLGATSYPLKRIFRKFMLNISQSKFIPSGLRVKMMRAAGIKIGNRSFVGCGVQIDGIRPDLVEIGEHVGITAGVKILTHFYNPVDCGMYLGKVTIGNNVFIGINSLIVNSVEIGENSVIAAGSVVIRDIPANEIWGGNPARFLKKRTLANGGGKTVIFNMLAMSTINLVA